MSQTDQILITIRELVNSNTRVRDALSDCVKCGITGSAVDSWARDSTAERVMTALFSDGLLPNGLTLEQHQEIKQALTEQRNIFKVGTVPFEAMNGLLIAFDSSKKLKL